MFHKSVLLLRHFEILHVFLFRLGIYQLHQEIFVWLQHFQSPYRDLWPQILQLRVVQIPQGSPMTCKPRWKESNYCSVLDQYFTVREWALSAWNIYGLFPAHLVTCIKPPLLFYYYRIIEFYVFLELLWKRMFTSGKPHTTSTEICQVYLAFIEWTCIYCSFTWKQLCINCCVWIRRFQRVLKKKNCTMGKLGQTFVMKQHTASLSSHRNTRNALFPLIRFLINICWTDNISRMYTNNCLRKVPCPKTLHQ